MPTKKPTKKEQQSLYVEILEKVSVLATAGLGLVAALACLPAEARSAWLAERA